VRTEDKKRLRYKLLRCQGSRCCYCKKRLDFRGATLDHVVPRCLGGSNRPHNLCVACLACNQKKGNKPPHLWINELAQGLAA